jgi:uncharacterized protein
MRLILRGTFDRHPDLRLLLGHWGNMLLFWMDAIPDPADRSRIAAGNAEALFHLT